MLYINLLCHYHGTLFLNSSTSRTMNYKTAKPQVHEIVERMWHKEQRWPGCPYIRNSRKFLHIGDMIYTYSVLFTIYDKIVTKKLLQTAKYEEKACLFQTHKISYFFHEIPSVHRSILNGLSNRFDPIVLLQDILKSWSFWKQEGNLYRFIGYYVLKKTFLMFFFVYTFSKQSKFVT